MNTSTEVLAELRNAEQYQRAALDALHKAHRQCGAVAAIQALRLIEAARIAGRDLCSLIVAIEQDASK